MNGERPVSRWIRPMVLACILPWSSGAASGKDAAGPPQVPGIQGTFGEKVAGLQFDATFELLFPVRNQPMGLGGSGNVLFARCWVLPGRIRVEITWAEPLWFGSELPWYLPTTVVRQTPEEFSVSRPRPEPSDCRGSGDDV